jgi:hypothetical protein
LGAGFATLRGGVVDYKGVMRTLVVVAGLVVPSVAAADVMVGDAAHIPHFVQIDRYDATSVVGGDLTYVALDGDLADDVTVMRVQLGGRYVDQQSRIGGYANIPVTYASGNDDSVTGIGNLEIGGLMLPKVGDGQTTLVLHAGITLPTGSSADDDGFFANAFSTLARPQDAYLSLPKGTSLRLGISPLFRSGNVFGRFDLGFDINLDVDGNADTDPVMHLNAGVGVDLGNVALMGELSNVYVFDDNDDRDFSDRLLNVLALSARFAAGNALPYVSLMVPLDDTTDAVDFALTAGIEAKL